MIKKLQISKTKTKKTKTRTKGQTSPFWRKNAAKKEKEEN
jgi:hypothetical protein